MKAIKTIILLCLITITFSSCKTATSCQPDENKNNYLTFFPANSEVEITVGEGETENKTIRYPEIEMVIFEYDGRRECLKETTRDFDFLDGIKNCKTVPNVRLGIKFGEIKIKYINNEIEEGFASLYLGEDGTIYAKHNENLNSNYAYPLNQD